MAEAISFLVQCLGVSIKIHPDEIFNESCAACTHIVFYLFKVVNYFDFTRVPDIRLWHTQGLRLFLSVHFNLLINFFITIFNFHIVLWLGILLSQGNISLIY